MKKKDFKDFFNKIIEFKSVLTNKQKRKVAKELEKTEDCDREFSSEKRKYKFDTESINYYMDRRDDDVYRWTNEDVYRHGPCCSGS